MIVVLCVSVGMNTNVKEIIEQKIAHGKMNMTHDENPKSVDSTTKPDNKKDDTTPIVKPVATKDEPKKDDVNTQKEEPVKDKVDDTDNSVQSSSGSDVKTIDNSIPTPKVDDSQSKVDDTKPTKTPADDTT
jgi:hypothetical protein